MPGRLTNHMIDTHAGAPMQSHAAAGSCKPAAPGPTPPARPGQRQRHQVLSRPSQELQKCRARPESPYEPLERAIQVREACGSSGGGPGVVRSRPHTKPSLSLRRDGAFLALRRRRCRRRRRSSSSSSCPPPACRLPHLSPTAAFRQVINRVIALGEKAKWGSGEAGGQDGSSEGSSEGSPAQERWVQFAAVYNSSLGIDQPAPGAAPSVSQQQQAVQSSADGIVQPERRSSSSNDGSSGSSSRGGMSSSSSSSGLSGRQLRDYLALPVEQYSLLDPKWISR